LPTSKYKKNGYTLNAANEIEGFLFNGPTPNALRTRRAI
jgi:hypothetical protein